MFFFWLSKRQYCIVWIARGLTFEKGLSVEGFSIRKTLYTGAYFRGDLLSGGGLLSRLYSIVVSCVMKKCLIEFVNDRPFSALRSAFARWNCRHGMALNGMLCFCNKNK